MSKVAIVAAMEREVSVLIKSATWNRVRREHEGRNFVFYESDNAVLVCAGIGVEAARRATEAVIALYHPASVQSVGFAGALDARLRVGDILSPSVVLDVRDGSRILLAGGDGILLTFSEVAGVAQKKKLARAYAAAAVDMEATAVLASASAHGIGLGVTKVISDELEFEIPGMSAFILDGQFRTTNFVLHVAMRPWLWTRVAVLARNSKKAARALAANLQAHFIEHASLVSSVTAIPSEGRK